MIKMAKWTREQTVTLLDLYKQYPQLYDNRILCYSDRNERNKILHIIAKELEKIRPKTSIRDVKQKIRTIRTQYSVERHKYHKSDSKECYSPRLWCYDSLKFLDGITTREIKKMEVTSNSLSEDDHRWESNQSSQIPKVEMTEDASRNSVNLLCHQRDSPTNTVYSHEPITCDVDASISPIVHLGTQPDTPQNSGDKKSRNYAFAKFVRGELDSIEDKEILEDIKWEIQMAIRNGLKRDRTKKCPEVRRVFQSTMILSPSPSQSSSSPCFRSIDVKQELSEDDVRF